MIDAAPRRTPRRWSGVVRIATERHSRDHLTGAATREHLLRRGPGLIASAQSQGRTSALLLLDIDGFKALNDTVGHHAGDLVLVETARRLRAVVGPGHLVVRLGGDEFAVLAADLPDDEAAERLAQDVVDALAEPVILDDLLLPHRASVGLALHDHDGETISALLRAADQAMYVAKATSPGRWRASSRVADRRAGQAAGLLAALRADPDATQIRVHYQPQVAVTTGMVVGHEALARWEHPQLGLLAPDRFIPLAERSGLMAPITAAVLDRALGDMLALQEVAPGTRFSLNVTQRHLMVRGLVEDILSRLAARQLHPSQVLLEIAEPMARASAATLTLFDQLHEAGIGLSVRSFGSAETSLTSLWTNPAIVEVKIDRDLVAQLHRPGEGERVARLTRAMTSAAHDLGIRVVAVGVETPASVDRLAALGCDVMQGFAIAPADTLDRTVDRVRHWPGVLPTASDPDPPST